MLGMAMLLGGSILSGAGSIAGGRQARRAGEYNARLLNQKASAIESASRSETGLLTERARKLKGSQIAAFASSGAQISSGTPLLVLAEQSSNMQRDINETRRTRMIEAQSMRSQAAIAKYKAKQASRAGLIGGLGSILGGVGTAGLIGGGGK